MCKLKLSLQLAPARKEVCQPHGINAVQLLFKKHFQSFADQYEDIYAVITESDEVWKILRHLVKIGRSPPGFDPASLN